MSSASLADGWDGPLLEPDLDSVWFRELAAELIESALSDALRELFHNQATVTGLDRHLARYRRRHTLNDGCGVNALIRSLLRRNQRGLQRVSRFVTANPRVVRGPNCSSFSLLLGPPAGFAPM